MKKAAIVTLYGNYNYGNKFQNYAVQEILKAYGYEVDTLVFSLSRFKDIGRAIKRGMKYIAGNKEMRRFYSLKKFSKEMLNVKVVFAKNGKAPNNIKKQYDFFCVGSDQVWNPEIRVKERNIFFLAFAEKNQRICVSPSIGVKVIESIYESMYREGLLGFEYLCCREAEGVTEIERISGKECVHLIDPTMALEPDIWRCFAAKRNAMISKKYILCFFLGDFNINLKERIQKYAEKNSLQLVIASDINSAFYSSDPREMLS